MKKASLSSNIEWKAWGKRDPLYAVASCAEKNKEGLAPWTDAEFYALGKSDWEDFHQKWRHYGLDNSSCIEIGCGAGRITSQLARCFQTVHALDVSEHMLDYARQHVSARNVNFFLSNGAKIPLPDGSVTAVFSCHVFQHFNSLEVARSYFAEIHRVVLPGGSLMVHLPIYAWPDSSRSFQIIHHLQSAISDFKAEMNRWLIGRGIFRPLMRRLVYPLDWLYAELARIGFAGIELIMVSPKSSNDPHAFILARKHKPAPAFSLEATSLRTAGSTSRLAGRGQVRPTAAGLNANLTGKSG